MSKKIDKYITPLKYTDKTLLVLSDTSGAVSLFLFNAVIGTPVGIESASISLVFLINNAIVKMLLKTKKKSEYEEWFISQK